MPLIGALWDAYKEYSEEAEWENYGREKLKEANIRFTENRQDFVNRSINNGTYGQEFKFMSA